MYTRAKWTKEEDQLLKEHYFSKQTKDLLELFLNRTYNAIKIHAKTLGLNRDSVVRSGNISKLLLETPEAYYWAGFVAADGHIHDNKRLKIALSIVDSFHLKRFCNFVETKNYLEYPNHKVPNCQTTIQDPIKIALFAKKFGFNSNKTINPPNLTWLKGDLFISFLCGFIDGDGCIKNQTGRKDSVITIKGHSSWRDNYDFFEKQIYLESKINKFNDGFTIKINNKGYATFCFSDRKVLNFLKNKTIELNLPILERKWSKIDLCLPVSRYESSNIIRKEIFKLKKEGLRQRDIAKRLKISESCVSLTINNKRSIENE